MTTLALRPRLVAAAALTVAVSLAVLTTAFNLVLADRLEHDADALLRSRADAQLATLTTKSGRLEVVETARDAVLDQRAWVFAGDRTVARAAGPALVQREVAALAGVRRPTARDIAPDLRVLAVPASRDGGHRPPGTVVVSVSRVPYEHTERIALVSTLVLDGFLLVAVVAVARRTVSAALRPVGHMTAQAEDWSARDIDRRFALGPPRDELTALAWTLDRLLDRLSASLRHEQRFSAEVAHELRTPLAGVRGAAELALRHDRSPEQLREALADVVRGTDRMTSVVDTLVVAAQREAAGTVGMSDGAAVAEAAVEACAAGAAARSVDLCLEPVPAGLRVGAEAPLVTRMLVPLVDNAVRYGRSRVVVSVALEDGAVVFAVGDDGPGVATGEAERIFDPGARGTAAVGTAGAGLGLALSRRLARAAGGDVAATAGPAGDVRLRLPAA